MEEDTKTCGMTCAAWLTPKRARSWQWVAEVKSGRQISGHLRRCTLRGFFFSLA